MEAGVIEGYRLSPPQERLRRLQRVRPACRTQCAMEIEGQLNGDALRVALQHLVERHEILRTSFHSPSGVDLVLQVIADHRDVPLQETDLRALDPAEQERRVEGEFDAELERGFDLESGTVLRAAVARLSSSRHVLRLASPSLCADAWSMRIMVAEFVRAYGAMCNGGLYPASEAVQYADVAQWWNDLLDTEDGRLGAAYWAGLEGERAPPLRLPFERDRRSASTKRMTVAAGPGLLRVLEGLAERTSVAMPLVLLACWQALLWRLGGEPDEVVVEVRFDGRKHEYLHAALGCFAQTVPVRCRLADCDGFDELVRRTDGAAADARRWQEFYPPAPAEASDAPRRVGFSFEEWPTSEQAGNATFVVTRFHTSAEDVKLELVCGLRHSALDVELRYDPAAYSEEDIEQVGEALLALIDSAAANPRAAVGELALLSGRAREQVLVLWNRTEMEYPGELCVHELFERQAARTPDAPAVVFEQVQLTYEQLNRQGNQLARHLRGLGAGPDVVVGLLVERSAEMVVALVGILKSGAAYLPLEPTLPKDRMRIMLDQAGAAALVVNEHLLDGLFCHRAVVSLEADRDALSRLSGENLVGKATAGNLAYVIFTSGSSGTPKGVAVEHRQLVNYVHGAVERLRLTDARSFGTVSTLGADLGNTAIFPALCTGAELHVISPQRAADALAMAEYCSERPLDCLKIVPSHLAALVASSTHPERILPRKSLVLGGEMLTWGTMRVFQSHAPGCRIFNHYGPTEATVGAVSCQVHGPQGEDDLSASVALGHPLPNTRIYVLDRRLQPVPVGVPGELYIGGAGVARGYVNARALTAARFTPDPFASAPGSRLYRTGDTVRLLPDGTIEFLGRVDRQVKLRGYRIELGEVEAVLRTHPDVRMCVAVLGGEPASRRLVVYAVGEADRTPNPDELHAYLKERLPEYMVPAHIALLDRMPLTPNGKIDHRALPAPEHILAQRATAYLGARTETEEILVGIFMLMLGVEQVGINDDFFDIGGHSLLATRLLSVIREVFSVEVTLRHVFEGPTVADLAAVIDAGLREGSDAAADPEAYWTRRLEGVPARLHLPLDHPREAAESRQRADVRIRVEPSVVAELRELGRRNGVTLYMMLLAAWQALLRHCTGQDDIVVASPASGWGLAAAHDGNFTRFLMMRTDLSGDPRFRELLGRVREVVLGAHAHRDVPFESLLHARLATGEVNGSPAVQVVLALENESNDAWKTDPAGYDLDLRLVETSAGLEGVLRYDAALFEQATVEHLAARLRVLLDRVARGLEQTLSSLTN